MQALCLADRLELRHDYPEPVPRPDEALVRVRVAGICGTDLELLQGYKGFHGVIGHEFVGTVKQCLEETWIGRRVVAEINVGETFDPRHEPGRQVLGVLGRDGAFAEYVAVPVRNLRPVPDGLPDQVAVFAEPLAAVLRMAQRLDLADHDRAAVLGPGRLGLLAALVVRLGGVPVTVLGRRPESLLPAARLGFATALAADTADSSYEVVVEATGSPAGLNEAIRLTRPLGTIALKSTCAGAGQVDATAIVVKELRVVGSRCGLLGPALDLLAAGRLDVARLIEAEYPLGEGLRALEHAARPGALKVLLRV